MEANDTGEKLILIRIKGKNGGRFFLLFYYLQNRRDFKHGIDGLINLNGNINNDAERTKGI